MFNEPTDQEVSNTTKKMSFVINKDLFKKIDFKTNIPVTSPCCYRDVLFYRLLNGWNIERKKAGYKPITTGRLAASINRNPFLKNDDGELELLIDECESKGHYKKAHWVLFPKKQ